MSSKGLDLNERDEISLEEVEWTKSIKPIHHVGIFKNKIPSYAIRLEKD